MKNNLFALLAIGSLLMLEACKKSTLFVPPSSSISEQDAFSTADRIDKSAVGMYDALQNPNFFGGRVLIYTDIRGLDAIPNSYLGNMGYYSSTTASDATVAAAWQGGYRTIYATNLFLKDFTTDKMSMVTAAKANQYIGEAKFIRSLCYFYLVNLWAQPYNYTTDASHPGVPLILTAADDPFAASNQVPRASVKQVYDQMESDLLDAESKLPLTYPDAFTRVARATKGAARALLMRLYLYKGDYAKANQYADIIINSGLYALNANPRTTFTNYTTNESIFSVAMNGGDNPNTNFSLGEHYGASARADVAISTAYVNLMDTTRDLRYKTLMEKVAGAFYTSKYPGLTNDFVPVLRYAEVLLTKAEALARMNTNVDATALSLLNQVRDRSNAGPVVVTSKAELIDAILKERRIELAFEGQASFEFQRNKLDLPAHGIVSSQPWGSNYRVLPIPKYDTDKDPQLVQNPGY
jgi:starch-binding outer membrane protein, SusD/RagB family